MSEDRSESGEYTGLALLLWNTARRRRGFTREEFDAELERADGLGDEGFLGRLGMFDGPDVPMPFPEDYDQPDGVLDYGSPGYLLDENGSVDGCHWSD